MTNGSRWAPKSFAGGYSATNMSDELSVFANGVFEARIFVRD